MMVIRIRWMQRMLSLLCAAAMVAGLSACSFAGAIGERTEQETTVNQESDDTTETIGEATDSLSSAAKEPELKEPESKEPGIKEPVTEDPDNGEPAPYDYTQPVPETDAVEDDYFSDAVFIGNSRTEGFMLYAGPSEATYITAVGLMVDTFFKKPYITVDGKKVTAAEALKATEFSKVYIMLGMNELGWVYPSVFIEYYGKIIDAIREENPEAAIYIQSILPVTAKKDAEGTVYNNQRISEYNDLLLKLAAEKEVYYVDVASAVAGEDGKLPEENSFDGVHLYPPSCQQWLTYLKTHTVEETP